MNRCATRYAITTPDGRRVEGYVMGAGGHMSEWMNGLKRLRAMAKNPSLTRLIAAPERGSVSVDVGSLREIFITLTFSERLARRETVPIEGATVEIVEC